MGAREPSRGCRAPVLRGRVLGPPRRPGGFPFLFPDELFSAVPLWWVLRNTVFCFVGGGTFMVFFYGRRTTIKYTAADQAPWVQIRSERDAEPGWIKVNVVDRGIGIPEDDGELIFEEFHRGPVEGRSPGSGLGLALTRRIVAQHGGALAACRNPEGGSTFTFTLPEA